MAWNMRVSRKEFLTSTIAMFFVFLLFFGIQILENPTAPAEIRLNGLHSAVSLCNVVIVIYLLVSGSWIFDNMKTTQQRIMFKMLPASYIEKFLARYVYVFILLLIGFFVAFCLADVARILICEIAGFEWCQSGIPMLFEEWSDASNFSNNGVELPKFTFALNLWALWIHSTYILGGVFFRRRQFIFTALLHFVLGMAVLWVFSRSIIGESKIDVMMRIEDMSYALAALFAALTVFNYWLSFRLFKRMQVINNKWVNV